MDMHPEASFTVPVISFERALDLYRDALGFRLVREMGHGPAREVVLLAPGAAVAITLVGESADCPAGSLRGAVLRVTDIASTLGCLRWAGVTAHWFDPWAPGGPAALFTDADGNAWTLWQPEEAAVRAA